MTAQRKRLISFFMIAMLLCGLAWWGLHAFHRATYVSYGYAVESRFTSMPPDDRALADWLKAQPGIFGHIGIDRRDDGRLLVLFGQSRNLLGDPPIPAIDKAAAKFGYSGGEPFHDSNDDDLSAPVY